MSAFVDTNVLVRHITGEPAEMAAGATAYLQDASQLLVTDLIVAETVYVLESVYRAPRPQVAETIRSLVALRSVLCVDPALLLRALEVYEVHRIDFAEAYLVACAETTGVEAIASFDTSIDRVDTVRRIEPGSEVDGRPPRPRQQLSDIISEQREERLRAIMPASWRSDDGGGAVKS